MPSQLPPKLIESERAYRQSALNRQETESNQTLAIRSLVIRLPAIYNPEKQQNSKQSFKTLVIYKATSKGTKGKWIAFSDPCNSCQCLDCVENVLGELEQRMETDLSLMRQ